MADSVARGGTLRLTVLFRAGNNGPLVDPVNPRVTILDPSSNVVVADATPVRSATGVFYYDFNALINAPLGLYLVNWSGVINGATTGAVDSFSVLEVGATSPWFGATVDDVRALLPTRPIEDEPEDLTGPSTKQVEGFLSDIADRVAGRIGNLSRYDDALAIRLVSMAKGLVALGAAAYTDDAGHPETTEPNASNYGGRLWERFKEGMADLEMAIKKAEDSGELGEEGRHRGAGVYAPPPLFSTRMRL